MRRLFIKIFPKLGLQILYFRTYKKFYNLKNPSGFLDDSTAPKINKLLGDMIKL